MGGEARVIDVRVASRVIGGLGECSVAVQAVYTYQHVLVYMHMV